MAAYGLRSYSRISIYLRRKGSLAMRSTSRAWDFLWAALGFLRRNRKQRKAAAAKRREMRRAHRYDALEQRVVLNADPIAVDDDYTVNVQYGFSGPIDVSSYQPNLGNDSDPDGPTPALQSSNNPGWMYFNGSGTQSYTYSIVDSEGAQATGNVRINVVEAANVVPTLSPPPTLTVDEGSAATLSSYHLSGSDLESGAAQLVYTLTAPPANGTVYLSGSPIGSGGIFTQDDVNNSRVSYVHNGSETASDSVSFSLTDAHGGSTSGSLAINVNPVNDPPSVPSVVSGPTVDGIVPWTFNPLSLLAATDPEGNSLTASVASWSGAVTDNNDGTFTYRPYSTGQQSFSVTVSDQYGATSTATINLYVAYNAPPTVNTTVYTLTIPAGSSTSVNWSALPPSTADYSDPEGNTPTITSNGNPGIIQNLGAGGYSYSYTVDDGHGNQVVGTVMLNINADYPPIANNDTYNVTVPYGGGMINWDAYQPEYANDSDPEMLGLWPYSNSNPGGLAFLTGGTYSYYYTVQDGVGNQATGMVTLIVTEAANLPPTANSFSFDLLEDSSLPIALSTFWNNAQDPEGYPLGAPTIVVEPQHGSMQYEPAGQYYSYTPAPNFVGQDSFTYQITDSGGATATGTVTINVVAVNDAPELSLNLGLTAAEGTTVTITNAVLQLTDVESSASNIYYQITTGPAAGTLTVNNNILGYGSVFSQADVDSGAVRYTHDGSETQTDFFDFKISDESFVSNDSIRFRFGITPVNDAPLVAVNVTLPLNEGATATIDSQHLTLSDVDSVAAERIFTLTSTLPLYGTLRKNGNILTTGSKFSQADIDGGLVTYTHDGGETLADSFSFTFSSGGNDAESTPVNFAFTVQPVNDAPQVSTNIVLSLDEGGATTIDSSHLSLSDVDSDPTARIYKLTTAMPQFGTLRKFGEALVQGATFSQAEIDAGLISYLHDGSEHFSDSFGFTISNGPGDTESDPITFSFTIQPVNDAPVASSFGFTADQNETNVGGWNLLTLAADVDGDSLSITAGTFATGNGSVTIAADGSFTYTPHNGYIGPDSFAYSFSDGHGGTATGTATIDVIRNVAPIANDDKFYVGLDTPLHFGQAQLVNNDLGGDNDSLEVVALRGHPLHGNVLWHSDGSFTYTPNTGFIGVDSFKYDVADETDEARATVWLEVGPLVTTAAGEIALSVAEDNALALKVTRNRVDGEPVTAFRFSSAMGTFRLNGSLIDAATNVSYDDARSGQLTFTPSVNFNGNAVINVYAGTLNGGTFAERAHQNATIEVTPVNDAPWATNVTYNWEVNHTPPSITSIPTPTPDMYGDIDGDEVTVAYSPDYVVGVSSGTLIYTVTDSSGATASGSITLNLSYAPNHNPENGNSSISVAEDGSITFTATATDADGDTLTYSYPSTTLHGGMLVNSGSGSLTYFPAPNYYGEDEFSYDVSDGWQGSATFKVSITVTPVNDPLSLTTPPTLSLNEGATATITAGYLQATDIDNLPADLRYFVTSGPANGTVTLSGTPLTSAGFTQADVEAGLVAYVHNGGETTDDSFSFSASDGIASLTSSLSITITPVNDPPTLAVNSPLTVVEGAAAVISSELLHAVDPELSSTAFTYVVTESPAHGQLSLITAPETTIAWFTQAQLDAGLVLYTNDGGDATTDRFKFTVADSAGATSAVMTFSIAVTPVDDAPRKLTVEYGPFDESSGTVTVKFKLASATPIPASVAWNTADGTARSGADYQAQSGLVEFAVGESEVSVTINISSDEIDEDDESFVIQLTNPIGIELDSDEADVTVADDDAAPTLSIASVAADESAGFVEFTITLSQAGERIVFVDWATQNDSAGVGDFVAASGRAAFAAGETSRKITVQLVDDEVLEGVKSFRVLLSNPVAAAFAAPADAVATATITSDDDGATRIVAKDAPAEDQDPIAESAGVIEFKVTLNAASTTEVTVDWETVDDTAVMGQDYILVRPHVEEGEVVEGQWDLIEPEDERKLTFAPGSTEAKIYIQLIDNATVEGDRSFRIKLTNPTNATVQGEPALVTISDDDIPVALLEAGVDSATYASVTQASTVVSEPPKPLVYLPDFPAETELKYDIENLASASLERDDGLLWRLIGEEQDRSYFRIESTEFGEPAIFDSAEAETPLQYSMISTGRIIMLPDGSFAYRNSGVLQSELDTTISDSFFVKIIRSDGEKRSIKVELTLHPRGPVLTITPPGSIPEGSDGQLQISAPAGSVRSFDSITADNATFGTPRLVHLAETPDDTDRWVVDYHALRNGPTENNTVTIVASDAFWNIRDWHHSPFAKSTTIGTFKIANVAPQLGQVTFHTASGDGSTTQEGVGVWMTLEVFDPGADNLMVSLVSGGDNPLGFSTGNLPSSALVSQGAVSNRYRPTYVTLYLPVGDDGGSTSALTYDIQLGDGTTTTTVGKSITVTNFAPFITMFGSIGSGFHVDSLERVDFVKYTYEVRRGGNVIQFGQNFGPQPLGGVEFEMTMSLQEGDEIKFLAWDDDEPNKKTETNFKIVDGEATIDGPLPPWPDSIPMMPYIGAPVATNIEVGRVEVSSLVTEVEAGSHESVFELTLTPNSGFSKDYLALADVTYRTKRGNEAWSNPATTSFNGRMSFTISAGSTDSLQTGDTFQIELTGASISSQTPGLSATEEPGKLKTWKLAWAGESASVTIHRNPAPETPAVVHQFQTETNNVHFTQDSSRTTAAIEYAGEGDLVANVMEGSIAIGFNPAQLDFAPTYIGGEQAYPIAVVETKLPFPAVPATAKVKLIVGGIEGNELTLKIPIGTTTNDVLRFSVPMVGNNLVGLATGRYEYQVVLRLDDETDTYVTKGYLNWVNTFDHTARDAAGGEIAGQTVKAPYGEGWSVADVSRLVYSSPTPGAVGGLMLVNGDGSTEWFKQYFGLYYSDLDEFTFDTGTERVWRFTLGTPGKVYSFTIDWSDISGMIPDDLQLTITRGSTAFADSTSKVIGIDRGAARKKVSLLLTPDDNGVIELKYSGALGFRDRLEPLNFTVEGAEFADLQMQAINNAGALEADPDPVGNQSGYRLRMFDADGAIRQYDLNGLLRRTTDADGNRTEYTYVGTNSDGTPPWAIKTITVQGGLKTTFGYNAGRLQTITDPTDVVATFDINSAGELLTITGPDPQFGSQQTVTHFKYDAEGLLKDVVRDNRTVDGQTVDQHTSIKRDPLTHRVSEVRQLVGETESDLDYVWKLKPLVAAGLPATATGEINVFRAGLNGRVGVFAWATGLKEASALYTDALGGEWIYQTDRFGYATFLQKPDVYKFDDTNLGGFTGVRVPDGALSRWERDERGRARYVWTALATNVWNESVRYRYVSYDYAGTNIKSVSYSRKEYVAPYLQSSFVGGGEANEKWEYEAIGVDLTFDGQVSEPFYDAFFSYRLKKHFDLADYTALDAPAANSDVGRTYQTYRYLDGRDNLVEITGSDGSKQYAYYTEKPKSIDDLAGGLIKLTKDATHGTTEYHYFDGTGPQSPEERKRIGLLESIVYAQGTPEQATASYTYDAHLHVDETTDIYGAKTNYDYDVLGRIVKIKYAAMSDDLALNATTVYDAVGNVIREKESAAKKNQYDTTSLKHEMEYKFDNLGRLQVSRDVERGATTEIQYYKRDGGSLQIVLTPAPEGSSGENGSDHVRTDYFYDSRGQLVAVVYPNSSYETPTWTVVGTGSSATDQFSTSTYTGLVFDRLEYDQQGQLVKTWTQRKGATVTDADKSGFSYDFLGRRTGSYSADPDGDSGDLRPVGTGIDFDFLGRQSDVWNNSSETTSTYDTAKRIVTTILYPTDGLYKGPAFSQTTTIFDQAGRMISRTDGRKINTKYEYDAFDRLKSTVVQFKVETKIDYFQRVRGTTSIYDENGLLIGSEETYSFQDIPNDIPIDDRAVRIERYTDPRKNETWKQYDASGNLIRVVNPDPDGEKTTLERTSDVYLYNADGTLAAEWKEYGLDHAMKLKTWYVYDAAGRLREVRDDLGLREATTYDRLDNIVTTTDAKGTVTKNSYDARGWIKKIETLDGAIQIVGTQAELRSYDIFGHLTHTNDKYGDDSFTVYDAAGRRTATYDYDYSFISDSEGYANSYHISPTKYQYNSRGLLYRMTTSDGSITEYQDFDALGNYRKAVVDPNKTYPEQKWTTYYYDQNNNLVYVKADNNDVTTFTYDVFDRVRLEKITLNGVALQREYLYDPLGNLLQYKDRDGRITRYEYDALNRKTKELAYDDLTAYANGRSSLEINYVYDQDGHLSQVSDANSTIVYSEFDKRGRPQLVTETVKAFGAELTSTMAYKYFDQLESGQRQVASARSGYTVVGRVEGVKYFQNTYQFDAAGREVYAKQLSPSGAPLAAPIKRVLHEYKAGGAPTDYPNDREATPYASHYDVIQREERNGGAWVDVADTSVYYERQDAQLIRAYDHRLPDGVLFANRYNYDSLDKLRRYVDRTTTNVQKYNDPVPPSNVPAPAYGRITSAGDYSYRYDRDGNRVLERRQNELSVEQLLIYDYDNRGRVQQIEIREQPSAGLSIMPLLSSVFYNFATLQTLASNATLKSATQYVYDAFDRVIAEKTGNKTLFYVYDGSQEVLRFRQDTADGPIKAVRRSFSSSEGDLFSVDLDTTDGVQTLWQLGDQYGTVREVVRLVDPVTKAIGVQVVALYDYDNSGKPTDVTYKPAPATTQQNVYSWVAVLVPIGPFLDDDDLPPGDDYPKGRFGMTFARFEGMGYNSKLTFFRDGGRQYDPNVSGYLTENRAAARTGENYRGYEPSAGTRNSDGQAMRWGADGIGRGIAGFVRGTLDTIMHPDKMVRNMGDMFTKLNYDGPTAVAQAMKDEFLRDPVKALTEMGLDYLTGKFGLSEFSKAGKMARSIRSGARATGVVDNITDAARALDNFDASAARKAGGMFDNLPGASTKLTGCFAAGTPVATESGLKPIQNVEPGERVWAFDTIASRWELRPVVETYSNEYVGLVVTLVVHGERVDSTYHHPVWVVGGEKLDSRPIPEHVAEATKPDATTPGRWVDAGDLRPGDTLLLMPDRMVKLEAAELRAGHLMVYNFQVAELHTYAVGRNRLLVHNNVPCQVITVEDMLAASKNLKRVPDVGSLPTNGVLDDVARQGVWDLDDFTRGKRIENHLAATEYSDWWHIGAEHNGFFEMIDFQKDVSVVSLKTVNTDGASWLGRMQDHIDDIARRRPVINDVPAKHAILDMRVQPGGIPKAASLIQFGRQRGIQVIIKEF